MSESAKKWEKISGEYRRYIKFERRLSDNSVDAYMRDFEEFSHFVMRHWNVIPEKVASEHIERLQTPTLELSHRV